MTQQESYQRGVKDGQEEHQALVDDLKRMLDSTRDDFDDYKNRLWDALGQPLDVELIDAVKKMREELDKFKSKKEKIAE